MYCYHTLLIILLNCPAKSGPGIRLQPAVAMAQCMAMFAGVGRSHAHIVT